MHVVNSASAHDLQLPRRRVALWTAPTTCRTESSKCVKARNPNRTMQHLTRRRPDRASRQMARERRHADLGFTSVAAGSASLWDCRDLRGCEIVSRAVRLPEAGGLRWPIDIERRRWVDDVVGSVAAAVRPCGCPVEIGELAHPEGDRVIRTGRIPAHAEASDDLPTLIERHPAAKRDDAAGHEPGPAALLIVTRVKGI
jgi:hypothetical protein